jgi:hypothetical protein
MAVRGRTAIYPIRIDQTTDSSAVIDYEHKEVHTGDAFYVTETVDLDDEVVNMTSNRFYTPNTTEWMHFIFVIESQGSVLIEIREGVTDVIGTDAGIRNRNRNFADALATMRHESVPGTAATGGTVIWSWASGGAAPASGRSPGVTRQSGELVLKQGTTYEVRASTTLAANIVSSYFTWYEHTNVEN